MTPPDAAVRADFDEVVRQLETVHPDFVAVVGPEDWAARVAATREALADVHDPLAFWWWVAPLVAAANDGHTALQLADVPALFPRGPIDWDLAFDGDRLVVRGFGDHPGPGVPAGGATLSAIDGLPVDGLLAELQARYGGETAAFRRRVMLEDLDLGLAVAVSRHSSATGPYRVTLGLPDGRTKEGVVDGTAHQRLEPRDRGWLNVDLAEPLASTWWTPAPGATLEQVLPRGVAERAGLRPGDRIVSFDGHEIRSADGLADRLARHTHRGDEVTVGWVRDGAAHTTTVALGRGRRFRDPPWRATFRDGALVLRIDAFERPGPFSRFVRDVLEEARARGTEHLIVDLRGDGGGDMGIAETLCAHVCTEDWRGADLSLRRSPELLRSFGLRGAMTPLAWLASADARALLRTPTGADWHYRVDVVPTLEPRFTGAVDVLTDPMSFSASVYQAFLLTSYAHARLIGEEPGSPSFFHGQNVWTALEGTGLGLVVATMTFRPVGAEAPVALVPDVPVPAAEALTAALAP